MEKSIYSYEYSRVLETLKSIRAERNMTQTEVAELLGQTQSFVSKVERGERRLDIVELRAFCLAMDISLLRFIKRIEREFSQDHTTS